MKRSFNTGAAWMLTALCALLTGCASNKADPSPEQYSGFLEDYSVLVEETDVYGDRVLRVISPRLTRQNYPKIIVDPIQLYPEPRPSEQVSADTLAEIKEYMVFALKRELGKKLEIVDQPGPGIARIRIALTALGSEAEGLKPYQYVPVALVLTGAHAAVAGRPQRATVFLEAETLDSVTGERLGMAVRGGTGEQLRRIRDSDSAVTLDRLKPLFDRWAEVFAAEALSN